MFPQNLQKASVLFLRMSPSQLQLLSLHFVSLCSDNPVQQVIIVLTTVIRENYLNILRYISFQVVWIIITFVRSTCYEKIFQRTTTTVTSLVCFAFVTKRFGQILAPNKLFLSELIICRFMFLLDACYAIVFRTGLCLLLTWMVLKFIVLVVGWLFNLTGVYMHICSCNSRNESCIISSFAHFSD